MRSRSAGKVGRSGLRIHRCTGRLSVTVFGSFLDQTSVYVLRYHSSSLVHSLAKMRAVTDCILQLPQRDQRVRACFFEMRLESGHFTHSLVLTQRCHRRNWQFRQKDERVERSRFYDALAVLRKSESTNHHLRSY